MLDTGDIILRSAVPRTSYVANLGTTIPNIIYNTTYRFVIERHLFVRRAWRFLAAPVQICGSPSLTSAWRESGSPLTSEKAFFWNLKF